MTVSLIPFVPKEFFRVVRHFLVLIPKGQGSFKVSADSRMFQRGGGLDFSKMSNYKSGSDPIIKRRMEN